MVMYYQRESSRGGGINNTLTYSRIPPGIENVDTAFRRQRLCACHDTLGTVYDTPSTWKLLEFEGFGGIDGGRCERHLDREPTRENVVY